MEIALNNLLAKTKSATTIEQIRELKREFLQAITSFSELNKDVEKNSRFDWYNRFAGVVVVLNSEIDANNFIDAKNSIISNIEAMQSFKKNPNELINYNSLFNKNKAVDKKEKLEYVKKHMDIEGIYMNGASTAYHIASDLHRLLWSIQPKDDDFFDRYLKGIDNHTNRLGSYLSKFNNAQRPTNSTKKIYSEIKKDIHYALTMCVTHLENK